MFKVQLCESYKFKEFTKNSKSQMPRLLQYQCIEYVTVLSNLSEVALLLVCFIARFSFTFQIFRGFLLLTFNFTNLFLQRRTTRNFLLHTANNSSTLQ